MQVGRLNIYAGSIKITLCSILTFADLKHIWNSHFKPSIIQRL